MNHLNFLARESELLKSQSQTPIAHRPSQIANHPWLPASLGLFILGGLLAVPIIYGQSAEPSVPPPIVPPPVRVPAPAPLLVQSNEPEHKAPAPNYPPQLVKFDLAFPGGTPVELVSALEKARGKSLNVIIPEAYRNTIIPPMKMKSITVPQLFNALSEASRKQVRVGNSVYSEVYSFTTQGPPTEDSIWSFFNTSPSGVHPEPPKICRYYQLGRYLDAYTVEDITTAIETGWKMLDATESHREMSMPALSFHKETKLLIAVGELEKLSIIDQVLEQLRINKPADVKAPVGKDKPPRSGEGSKF